MREIIKFGGWCHGLKIIFLILILLDVLYFFVVDIQTKFAV